jgi:hypothetical protein
MAGKFFAPIVALSTRAIRLIVIALFLLNLDCLTPPSGEQVVVVDLWAAGFGGNIEATKKD